MVNLGPIALLSEHKVTQSSGKHLQEISHADIVSLLYKLISSSIDIDILSIGFDRDRNRRQRELTNNKKHIRKIHLRNMLKDVFGFAQHQQKATNGLGYKLTLTRNTDNSVFNKANAINKAKMTVSVYERYVPHYTPSIPQQAILSKQILNKVLQEVQNRKRSVFLKK